MATEKKKSLDEYDHDAAKAIARKAGDDAWITYIQIYGRYQIEVTHIIHQLYIYTFI